MWQNTIAPATTATPLLAIPPTSQARKTGTIRAAEEQQRSSRGAAEEQQRSSRGAAKSDWGTAGEQHALQMSSTPSKSSNRAEVQQVSNMLCHTRVPATPLPAIPAAAAAFGQARDHPDEQHSQQQGSSK
ncbi:unnamed protein product [Closterium sp. Naga37s-1]|nr:unnamed protein product [Closterium sp. Naga37s-1]